MSKSIHPLNAVRAAILAGGLGTRLRSVVPDRPKVLAEVNGRPFIAYLLDQLHAEGVEAVVLCTGYKGEQVEQLLGSSYRGLALYYSREAEPLGTGGALRLALPQLPAENVLVMNGDSFCDAQLRPFAGWHLERQSPATLLLSQCEDTRRFGRVDLDEQGNILQFQEKAAVSGPGWINAGIYLLRRTVIEAIPMGRAVSIEREVFPGWIGKGLSGWRSEGSLRDIGVPDAYAEAQGEFARRAAQ